MSTLGRGITTASLDRNDTTGPSQRRTSFSQTLTNTTAKSLQKSWLAVIIAITAGYFVPCCESSYAEQTSNQVGLSDLIALALRNDPGLVALRDQISIEDARKRAAAQWRDPEIRGAFTRDDELGIDEFGSRTNGVRVRFFVPKPWEMKALVNQAAREVELAGFQVTAGERQVILEIRQQYEELQYLKRKLDASHGMIAIIERHVAKEEELLNAGGAFTLDQLSFEDIKIPGIKLAISAAEAELNAAKSALAARVGLESGSRIRCTDALSRSAIKLKDSDLDYLTLMAFAHRGEVGVLKHEQAIAEAELGTLKTKRIPWFNFIESDYGRDYVGGTATDESYGVRFAVILPVFSWLGKDEKVVEERIKSYYSSLEANQKSIANEVAEAFRSVEKAIAHRARTEAVVDRYSVAMNERAKALDASEDLAAIEQLRYETEVERSKFEEYNLAANRLYNQSLIRLEQALGTDLDRVFKVEYESASNSQVVSKSTAFSGPAPPVVVATEIPAIPEARAREIPVEAAKPKRKGLLNFLKDQNKSRSSSGD